MTRRILARIRAASWRLPWIVEPMQARHGHYSIILTRDDAP